MLTGVESSTAAVLNVVVTPDRLSLLNPKLMTELDFLIIEMGDFTVEMGDAVSFDFFVDDIRMLTREVD